MKKLIIVLIFCLIASSCAMSLDSGEGIGLSGNETTNTITISGVDAGYYTKGIAEFNPGNFTVVDGAVSLSGNISGGGASAFTDLTDVPSDYAGYGGKAVRVSTYENGLEFANPMIQVYTDGLDPLVSGNVTFKGLNGIVTGGYVGGDPTITISPPALIIGRMERQAALNIAISTYQSMAFDTKILEQGVTCDTANGYITIVTAGYYLCVSHMLMQDAVGKYRCLYFYVNNVQISPYNWIGVNALYPTVELVDVLWLNVGDHIEARIWQDIANPRALYVGNPHGNSLEVIQL